MNFVTIVTSQIVKMSTSPGPSIRICHFDGSIVPLKSYFCYDYEVCCKEGCCSSHEYRYFQSWYFWLGLITIFILYRYICWYCKKTDDRTGLSDGINPHIVNLMVAYHNNEAAPKDDVTDPPPLYNIAVNLPKPQSSKNDEIPTYEEATTMK